MSITEASLSTSAADCDVLAGIRHAIADFLQHCGLQYTPTTIDEELYNKCCQDAINRGFPMSDEDYSLRPYMVIGVTMSSIAYGHLTNPATRMWLCHFTAAGICVDDTMKRQQDMENLYRFNERFATCQPQGDAVLNTWDEILRETPRHFSPLVSGFITTSTLDFISGLLLEYETQGMKISRDAPMYPEYTRLLSGLAHGFAYFVFPPTVPLLDYVQCIPDLMFFLNHANDILSYYKEEIEGDSTNYVSLLAASRGLTKHEALCRLIEKTVLAHHNIVKCLKPHPEAYEAYASVCHGYIKFHTALKRYMVKEIMAEKSLL
ncbi:isoprenoid synthase domain-containing protein [Suillus clintonianus]|uniref:isoprenoid synthase domain-containing protein n=1 Tax=Suillus clintonianus TaxID=1904413 RepID=UPI001B878644|nr:isoprenoid synthase domain-containing protein [Suillus clintonianus]KAG2142345.1 isoprenoid synthase domain-containing protein [Suillus clintonianus]